MKDTDYNLTKGDKDNLAKVIAHLTTASDGQSRTNQTINLLRALEQLTLIIQNHVFRSL